MSKWVVLLIVCMACGDSDPEVDAGMDASMDAMDLDGATDANRDAPTDASADASADAETDASVGDADPAPELDRDGDGVEDEDDAFPDDPTEWIDSDGDGVGNAAQTDEDGDGTPDEEDAFPFDPAASSAAELALPADGTPTAASLPFVARTAMSTEVLGVIQVNAEAQSTLGFRVEGDPDAEVILNVVASASTGSVEPLDEIEAYEPGVQVWAWTPPTNEVFDVVITSRSESAVDAIVSVFRDTDADGLSDDFELVLGMRPGSPDPDADALGDYAERLVGSADTDGDGLLAWFDGDSDADGLFDGEEGADDVDGDGIRNFVDTDSDGDGVDDADSPGVSAGAPIDTDGDNVADWLDRDDDGDGVLDINDDDPSEVVVFTEGFTLTTPFVLEEAAGVFPGDQEVPGVVFPGALVRLHGEGFTASATMCVVAYEDGHVENRPATFVSATQLSVQLDRVGTARLFLLRGSARTTDARVEVLPDDHPVLFPAGVTGYNAFSRSLRLDGVNLEQVNRVRTELGESSFASFNVGDGTLTVGGEFLGSQIRPVTDEGHVGNEVTIRAVALQSVDVNVPVGAVFAEADLELSGHADEVVTTASGSLWNVNAAFGRPAVVEGTVAGPAGEPRRSVLRALVAPSILSPQMDEDSTAAVVALQLNQAWGRLDDEGLEAAYLDALADADVLALGAAIATAAASGNNYLADPPASMIAALDAALIAGEAIVDARAPRPPAALIREGIVTPGEQFDIRVFQTDLRTGNLSVENDTSVYLSAEVRNSVGHALQPHIASYFDLKTLSPQRGLFLAFDASVGNLSAPGGRNADVDIVTPGLRMPQPSDTRGTEAQFFLRFRTIVDRVLLPVFNEVVGAKLNPGPIAQSFLIHNYDVVQDVRSAFAAGNAQSAVSLVVNAFLRDADNLGPMTRLIARMAFGVAARPGGVIARIAARLASNLNLTANVVNRAATFGAAVGVAKAIDDFVNTPGLLQWRVEFGLEITESSPLTLERRRRPQTLCLQGVGFRQTDGTAAEVVAQNTEGIGIDVEDVRVNENGTEMCVYLGSEESARLGNVVDFVVSRADTDETVMRSIPVERTFIARFVRPAELTFRERARVDGAGFGEDASRLRAVFRRAFDGSVVASGAVLEAHGTWVTFDTPQGIEMGETYDLSIDIVTPGEEESSNAIPVNVGVAPVAGTYTVRWRAHDLPPSTCEPFVWSANYNYEESGSGGQIILETTWGGLDPGPSPCRILTSLSGTLGQPDFGIHATQRVAGTPGADLACQNNYPNAFTWRAMLRQGRGRYHFHLRDSLCGVLRTIDADVRFTPATE